MNINNSGMEDHDRPNISLIFDKVLSNIGEGQTPLVKKKIATNAVQLYDPYCATQ